MSKVELTPAKLADIKKKAEAAKDVKWPTIEQFPQHEEYPAAELIAAADPATVLAMVEEIEFLRRNSMIKTELLGKFMFKTKENEASQ